MTEKNIGRFEIRRELGRGAQSIVYLAWDPQLQREVAIKTLHFSKSDPALNETLLREALTVSKLKHSNVVPIFDVGQQGNDPYLVFEYVEGSNLDRYIRDRGRLSDTTVVAMMIDVLAALEHAHSQGVIHRDLKPTNILIDGETPRVMDFGIALRIADADKITEKTEGLVGTPQYLSPEYITKRIVGVQGDIYAAGLIMLEMLSGRRMVDGDSLPSLLYRVVNEPIAIPEDVTLDLRLADIILRACSADLQTRYATASQMRQALEDYENSLSLNLGGDTEASEAKKQSTLEFLLRRMRHKSDFPALSDSVSTINKLTSSDKESINRLSNTILKDYALTNKILRIVNAAYFRQAGGGTISTISRAVIVLGFDAIRNIVITVLLFEHLQDKGNVKELREAFLRANLAGFIGRSASVKLLSREAEESFICSMFHGLGGLLAQYYFPEEVEQMRRIMVQKKVDANQAASMVLGITLEDLGIGIARTWGFPPSIVNSMRKLSDSQVRKPATHDEALRLVAGFANELCDQIADTPMEDRSKALKALTERFASSINFSEPQIKESLEKAMTELATIASSLHVNLKQSPFASQARAWSGHAADESETAPLSTPIAESLLNTSSSGSDDGTDDVSPVDAQTILAAGIQDISNSLVEDFSLNDILRIILETIYRAMGFNRVLLCLRDARSNTMVGRFGFGQDAAEVVKRFKIPLSGAADVFAVATTKGLDISISDIDDPKIAERIPAWYRGHVPARSFVLFPLIIKNNPVALIYCDKDQAGSIKISDKELSLLKTLRNQAVLAIKQTA